MKDCKAKRHLLGEWADEYHQDENNGRVEVPGGLAVVVARQYRHCYPLGRRADAPACCTDRRTVLRVVHATDGYPVVASVTAASGLAIAFDVLSDRVKPTVRT